MAHQAAMELQNLLRRPERWASVLGRATLAGLEFGLLGPFGSYASNVFSRIAYWTALFWIGSLILWPAALAGLVLGPKRGFPPLFSAIVTLIVACVPLAVLGAIETHLFWPIRASLMKPLEYYGLTLLVALPAVAGLLWLQFGHRFFLTGETEVPQPARRLPVLEPLEHSNPSNLPDHLLATALCLQMEDHHVRVHLMGRSHLHYGVMRDVIGALDESQGLQVHRSWWVAKRAVREWQCDGRSVILILVNDLRVPVARNRIAVLRAHGWLPEGEGDSDTEPLEKTRLLP